MEFNTFKSSRNLNQLFQRYLPNTTINTLEMRESDFMMFAISMNNFLKDYFYLRNVCS